MLFQSVHCTGKKCTTHLCLYIVLKCISQPYPMKSLFYYLFFFSSIPWVRNYQMNKKIIPLFLCSRYDVRGLFRIQTLSSLPWLPKYPILACSSFDTSANAYLLQLSYTLFESSQYSKFDNQIKQLSL